MSGESFEAPFDVLIVGAGPIGLACAIECGRFGLRSVIIEKGCVVNSLVGFPSEMTWFSTPELMEIGGLPFPLPSGKANRAQAMEYYRKVRHAANIDVRTYESVERIEPKGASARFRIETLSSDGTSRQYDADNTVVATGYFENPNMLHIPGENLPHVSHYYTEAHPYDGLRVVVIGAQASAVDAALDLYRHGALVTLIHRGEGLGPSLKYWVRPDIENRIKKGEITAYFNTVAERFEPSITHLVGPKGKFAIECSAVFVLTGFTPDAEFLKNAGITIDEATSAPVHDETSFETNIPGLYVAGPCAAGIHANSIFIENGREHALAVAQSISRSHKKGS